MVGVTMLAVMNGDLLKWRNKAMAVTRSFLKGMGLTDEQVSAIIEEHSNTVNGLIEARDSYKADAEKVPELQQEIDKAYAEY